MLPPDQLRALPPFTGFSEAALAALAARAEVVVFPPRRALFRRGEPPRGLYVVRSGRVRVVRSRDGRQHVLHEERAGGTLGEIPLLDGQGYPATGIAAERTECIVVSRAALAAAIRADPDVAWTLLARLARRLRGLVERLDRMVARDVTGRLAEFLAEGCAGQRLPAVAYVGTQSELAEELGTVREVVVRSLGRLRRSGAVASGPGGTITVLDRAELLRVVPTE